MKLEELTFYYWYASGNNGIWDIGDPSDSVQAEPGEFSLDYAYLVAAEPKSLSKKYQIERHDIKKIEVECSPFGVIENCIKYSYMNGNTTMMEVSYLSGVGFVGFSIKKSPEEKMNHLVLSSYTVGTEKKRADKNNKWQ